MFPKPSLDLWPGKAVIQGLMVPRPYLHLWDVQNGTLALSPGLWKISCSKQKWKNSPEELEEECVAWTTGFFPYVWCVAMEGRERVR